METIFALASARGKAGVATVRVSGPAAFAALAHFTSPVKPRVASLRMLRDGGDLVDQALVLAFPGPNSFTGEDVVEFHLHGSQAIVAKILRTLGDLPGLRLAEPGEFTRRALENEQVDLTQVEGLSDLIEAETEAQRRQAMRVLSGELGQKAEVWRQKLLRAAALMEATIDFVDEDVPVDVVPDVIGLLDGVLTELELEIDGVSYAERVRDGFEIAIVGPPNAGKSTLLNHLAGREAAITSDIGGTTRDVLEVRMDLKGIPVSVLDTAGIRDTEDRIERIGIGRALERAHSADLRIILDEPGIDLVVHPEEDDLVLVSKSDIRPGDFSAHTGEGVSEFMDRLAESLMRRVSAVGVATNERHREAMSSSIQSLRAATGKLEDVDHLPELVAEDIRGSVRSLDSLIGRIGVEDVLGEIFSSFCIGK